MYRGNSFSTNSDLNLCLSFPGHVACSECRVEHPVPKEGFINHFVLDRMIEHLAVHDRPLKRRKSLTKLHVRVD